MSEKHQAIKLFEEKLVRTVWDDDSEKYWFSVVDICAVLTDSDYQTARKYWKVLKGRIANEGSQLVTNCYQLKKENLRDNMTNTELVLNMLAEVATTDISVERQLGGYAESADVAREGVKTNVRT